MLVVTRRMKLSIVYLLLMVSFVQAKEKKLQREKLKDIVDDISSLINACKAVGYVKANCKVDSKNTSVNRAVAFEASLTKSRNSFTGRVIFGKVALNAGHGYDGSTGIFTAPKTGLYVFEWTTVVWPGKVSYTLLNAGGQKRGKNYCNDTGSSNDSESCSRMSVVKLNSGEKAWIETYSTTALHQASSIACFML
ncbi:uncharacterized protein LOC134238353 [Saccostrea cucullata]|uniref:uncharacterized protein LOC134238353 n=1 Tax=Saccostrea cuccullata TaxID=36930 RepID=UPI002ED3F244